jgi:hypothetical protein
VLPVILPGIVPGHARGVIGGKDIHYVVLRSPGLMHDAELAEIIGRPPMVFLMRLHGISGEICWLALTRLQIMWEKCSLHSELRISRMGRKTMLHWDIT